MAGGESANLQSWASEGVARGIVPPLKFGNFSKKENFENFSKKGLFS